MKNSNIKLFGCTLMATMAFASCSDEFLEEKKNYDNVNVGIYDYYSGANARVSDIYSWSLPDPNGGAAWNNNSTGQADDQSKSTEEYSGFGAFVNPQNELTITGGTKVPDYFHNQQNNIQTSVWGRIRNINDVIRGITEGNLSQEEKDELLGQVYFFRAWCYYNLVKWYGSVPIIKDVLEPIESSTVPRSSAKACIEFICEDLDTSASMLEAATTSGGWTGENWGRVTSGTALALKGRVLLLWASPMFNRKNEVERWENAYQEIKRSIPVLNACGYGLHQSNDNINASAFAEMFSMYTSPEAVFVVLFNIVKSGDGQKNNSWERGIRPKNATGGGGKEASAMLVDMFPMADGKRPALSNTYTKLEGSTLTYEENYPFMDRDPRFYRTFAFPGVRWAYAGNPTIADPDNPPYNQGKDYELWNYVWYTSLNDQGNAESGNSYGADNLLSNKKGIYVRKRSDDLDVNGGPLYAWADSDNNGGFAYSSAPYMEIRYAEVLLNYAEAACGAGHLPEAVEQLKQIRKRAGYTTADCGLQADLSSNQAACMAAVLYERQIELAYEGKRFDDLRRWMLFDGGAVAVEGAPSSWTLSGWDGNTCTYLGFKPLNGQRRENLEFRIQDSYGIGGTTADSDPLRAVTRPAAVDYRKDLTSQLETLKTFYSTSFVRKLKRGDAYDQDHIDLTMNFLPRYYFLGLAQSAQSNNKHLDQTIGWEDYNKGNSNGIFDPLAEE
jgi:hypothetical protein